MANQDFYIDKNGLKIPTSENFTARVLVANGLIPENFSGNVDTIKTRLGKELFQTALFIKNDTLWNDQIEQIYVTEAGIMELVPRVGNHRIILGNADSLEVKFRNLLAFYKKAIPQVGWDTYKSINIQYFNQVVCEKNEKDSTKTIAAASTKIDSIKTVVDTTFVPDTTLIPDTIILNDTIITTLQ
jgi:cell division protein FtsQ